MSVGRKYYEAYDDRYRQVHDAKLQWASDLPSPIVTEVISKYRISCRAKILEVGCGEGRDAQYLLEQGYDLLATDISPEAISYCRGKAPEQKARFRVLNCITDRLDEKYDFIYAVAVIHMLVADTDRDGFYAFVREQLSQRGIGLICTMGDGTVDRCSDIASAFELQERTHTATGRTIRIAGTSCRMVTFDTFREELCRNGLAIKKMGLTSVEPDFPVMMYAVVSL